MTLDITVTDMFCGAGGSTTGATLAGATVRLAINHWKRAIETHTTNYPDVTHALTDLHTATPRRFPSTTMLIASPECSAHTLARGRKRKAQGQPELWEQGETDLGAEAEERSRCTMWTPLDWAEHHDYQAVILENVVDAHLWRPFMSWLQAWRSLGYDFELVYLNSMHAHPTPQSRDRMYFVAWKHGNRKPDLRITPPAYCAACGKDIKAVQSWKNPARRYGKYRQQYVYRCPRCAREVTPYYYAAANAIDWSLSAPRIGDRARPLREKTMQRIAYGRAKFAREPHAMPLNTTTGWGRTPRQGVHPQPPGDNGLAVMMPFLLGLHHPTTRAAGVGEQPFPTQTTYDDTGLTVPPAFLLHAVYGQAEHTRDGVPAGEEHPFSQTTRRGREIPLLVEHHDDARARALTTAFSPQWADDQHHGPVVPPFVLDHLGEDRPRSLTRPLSTICAVGNHHGVVIPLCWLMTYYQHGQMAPVGAAAPTVTTLERHALVTGAQRVDTAAIAVEDCGFRMLVPREIQAAMAFPADYVVTGTRREQVKQLGNAVTPPVMQLLMERVIASL